MNCCWRQQVRSRKEQFALIFWSPVSTCRFNSIFSCISYRTRITIVPLSSPVSYNILSDSLFIQCSIKQNLQGLWLPQRYFCLLRRKSSYPYPISSTTIVITADSSTVAIGSKTTADSTGKYIADELKAPTKAGSYDIQAHFYGDTLYSAKDSPKSTLTVTAAPQQIFCCCHHHH